MPLPRLLVPLGLLALAFLQHWLVGEVPEEGLWFLYGRDTVSHDVPVHWWVWQQVWQTGEIPLWMPPLQGGLPVLGAWLWTPLAPSLWLHAVLPFPLAQRLQFVWASWWAMLGGYWLARVLGMRRGPALLAGIGYGLGGHLVTLAHAGHLQKILALAWLPWLPGGVAKALGEAAARRTQPALAGAAVAGLALGAAFLSGHPQIAYTMAMLVLARALFLILPAIIRKDFALAGRAAALTVMIGALGGGLAAAQLLPGLEMGAVSNRAAGVSFEEAVESSYPPAEIVELAVPGTLGNSSQRADFPYQGAWGERLVSDYLGAGVVGLALAALIAVGLGVACPRREIAFWAGVAAVSLLVGFGRYTPLYEILYNLWPGFSRFRSPGTFMAAAALAVPVLGAYGLQATLEVPRDRAGRLLAALAGGFGLLLAGTALGWVLAGGGEFAEQARAAWGRGVAMTLVASAVVFAVWRARVHARESVARAALAPLLLLLAIDLGTANAKYLVAVPWNDYEQYMAPGAIDLQTAGWTRPVRVLEAGKELSLRPLFNGRDAMLGYHPISFGAFEEHLRATGMGSPEWRAQWGINHVWFPPDSVPDFDRELVRFVFAAPPFGALINLDDVPGKFRIINSNEVVGKTGPLEWVEREPNAALLRVEMPEAGTFELAEVSAPGWRVRVDGGEWEKAESVSLSRRVDLPAGESFVEWQYRPAAWRVGLLITTIAWTIIVAIFMAAATRRWRYQ